MLRDGAGRRHCSHRLLLVAGFAALLAGACRDPKVAAYQVPKEAASDQPAATAAAEVTADAKPSAMAAAASAMPAAMPGGMPGAQSATDPHALATAQGNALSWSAPASWEKKNASTMRKATYAIGAPDSAAELAISAYPGDVGGEVGNVNRWRGQIGLDPLSDAEATAAIVRIEANGLKIGYVDIANPAAGERMIGVWVPFEGATWFFKLMGTDAALGREKPGFLEFLKTIKPAAGNTP